jgi:hypothetical protein
MFIINVFELYTNCTQKYPSTTQDHDSLVIKKKLPYKGIKGKPLWMHGALGCLGGP